MKAERGDHAGAAKADLDRDAQRKVEGEKPKAAEVKREAPTPGGGPGPQGRQGDEVDPGVG